MAEQFPFGGSEPLGGGFPAGGVKESSVVVNASVDVAADVSSGYGIAQDGLSRYGFGETTATGPVSARNLFVQPAESVSDEPVTIAGVGCDFLETSRDDDFSSDVYNAFLWMNSVSGITRTSHDDGLFVELLSSASGSSYTLSSNDSYQYGDIEFQYNITSPWDTDDAATGITYAAMQMDFGSNTSLTIARKLAPTGKHQVVVTYVNGGVTYATPTMVTNDTSGSFRLIKSAGTILALYNNQILFNCKVALSTFTVRLYSSFSEVNQYVGVVYTLYKSSIGVAFGDEPIITKTYVNHDRVLGVIPDSSTTGPVDVVTFNHNGQIATSTNGFKYDVVTGALVSANNGMNASIQTDPVLRS